MSQTGARRAFLTLAAVSAVLVGGAFVAHSPLAHGSAVAATARISPGGTGSPSPVPSRSAGSPTPSPAGSRPSTTTPSPSPSPSASADAPGSQDAASARQLDSALADAAGSAAVAVADLSTGATLSRGDTGHLFDTASIVKADILAALLVEHQDAGTTLTADQRELATRMIEQSDNDAATSLLAEVGGPEELDEINARFGLHHTTVGTGGYWGLTTTTAVDQLTLLQQIFGTRPSKLSTASRNYVRSLMGEVEADQNWGVSAAAGSGDGYALKNGWLSRSATGLWVINSIGEVDRDGHTYLVAVLSDGNPTMDDGISLVEHIAEAAVAQVAGP
ncbi:serine hydrolase [Streptacidiphilus anmyonensis]|uniref:serine hydrolase n=1 Tax=Streptacidiphilus anmyonensis TaxID=405782 RepID=UPI0005AA8904|nr:serine hydrolase [Streptacidiphilus anmyonensis]